jgi:hypothetical protein
MRPAGLLFVVVAAAVAMAGSAGAQELPAGPNRDVVSRTCSACHDLGNLTGTGGLSREGWESTLEEMAGYGMNVTPDERTKIIEYLATDLGPKAAQGGNE